MTIKNILVPVDYSECSLAALSVAKTYAEKFGASLDIVHVWDRPSYVSGDTIVRHGDTRLSLLDMIRENAQRDMNEFVSAAKLPATIRSNVHLLSGNPAAALLGVLREGKYDLVVLGTHGRTGLSHVLLGSVAETLVRLSPVPVLTVPRPRSGNFPT